MAEVLLGLPEKVFDKEAGAYYRWTAAKMPVLRDAKVGAARLVLQRQGFAFPHFGDSTKIGFVLQGSGEGMAGLICPDKNGETVVSLKKGDCITINEGVVSWWYNPGADSVLDIVFIGETANSLVPGQFTYQFFSGASGFLNSFSPEFISSLYVISAQEANRLATTQPALMAIKLPDGGSPMESTPDLQRQNCFSFHQVSPDLEVSSGGVIRRFTSGDDDVVKVGPVEGAELSAFEIKLEPGKGLPPVYMARAATQVFYVTEGKVWVQILSPVSGRQLDEHVDAGHLFVVPMFYTVSMVAGDEGAHCLSVMNTSKPVLGQLGNIWSSLSPGVLEAALNLNTKDIEISSGSNIKEALIINQTI